MPSKRAMISRDKIITATPETTLAEALDLFDKNSIRAVPVIDSDDNVVGLFNFSLVLKTILPLSLDMGHRAKEMEISLDHLKGQSCWVSGRLKEHLDHPLKDLMATEIKSVNPETPLRESVRLLAQNGSPLTVVEEGTNKLVGLISSQTALKVLLEMKVNLKRS